MGRAKLPRKSTAVDMTPFCDVAFLLLTFFILTTKFKPDQKIDINTPSSVSSKVAPEKNFIMISLNKDGKAFLNSDNYKGIMQTALDNLNSQYSLGLSPNEVLKLSKVPVIGTSLQGLKQYSQLPPDALNDKLPGIPIDSTHNELTMWMKAFVDASSTIAGDVTDDANGATSIILKGDNLAKFPQFKNVIAALTENHILKFQMVTNPEAVPTGSELWKKAQIEKTTTATN
ncbi:MAG: biopolymer transporter ExbD [Arachidicoccus sp.]|nr:biopolymer transporter ExbD [Arachidicoccus sp.]